ncbi:hypothetical protein EDC01DRAFT_630683 [Geopyxis carbonaria]|nr:hypothetical protein EDC01DRAFT_630683 [Geopyxis carbonaria]
MRYSRHQFFDNRSEEDRFADSKLDKLGKRARKNYNFAYKKAVRAINQDRKDRHEAKLRHRKLAGALSDSATSTSETLSRTTSLRRINATPLRVLQGFIEHISLVSERIKHLFCRGYCNVDQYRNWTFFLIKFGLIEKTKLPTRLRALDIGDNQLAFAKRSTMHKIPLCKDGEAWSAEIQQTYGDNDFITLLHEEANIWGIEIESWVPMPLEECGDGDEVNEDDEPDEDQDEVSLRAERANRFVYSDIFAVP